MPVPVGPASVMVLDAASAPLELVVKPTMYVVVAEGVGEDGDAVTLLTLVPMAYSGLLGTGVVSAEVETSIV